MKKYLKLAWRLVLAFILLTVLLSLVITVGLVVANHKGVLKRYLAKAYPDVTLTYQKAHVSWHWGDPSLTLDGIQMIDKAVMAKPIKLDHLSVDLAIWSSIIHREFVTSRITVSGLKFNVVERNDGSFSVQGFSNSSNPNQSFTLDPKLLSWFLTQGSIYLNDFDVHLSLRNAQHINIKIDHAMWFNHFFYRFRVKGEILEIPNSQFNLYAKMKLNGNPGDLNAWAVYFDGNFSGDTFAPLLNKKAVYGVTLLSGGGNVDFSGEVNHEALQAIKVKVDLANVNLHQHASDKNLATNTFDEEIDWTRQDKGGWTLSIMPTAPLLSAATYSKSHLRADLPGMKDDRKTASTSAPTIPLTLKTPLLRVSYMPTAPQFSWQISAQNINLPFIGEWLDLWFADSTSTAQMLHALAPSGTVNDLNLKMGTTEGEVHFLGTQIQFARNPVFPKTWPASDAEVSATWNEIPQKNTWNVNIQKASLAMPHLKFLLQGTAIIPFAHPSNPTLNLHASFEGHDLEGDRMSYIPVAGVPKELTDWLVQGLVKIPAIKGNLVWQGQLNKMPYARPKTGLFDLNIEVKDGTLSPWQDWPLIDHVNINLVFKNQLFTIDGTAMTMNVPLQKIHFEIADLRPNKIKKITISGETNPSATAGLAYLTATPLLDKKTRDAIVPLRVTSDFNLGLLITIPLDDAKKPLIASGNLTLHHNALYLDQGQATTPVVQNMQGSVHFINDSFSSAGVNLTAMGETLHGTISESPIERLKFIFQPIKLFGQDFSPLGVELEPGEERVTLYLDGPAIQGNVILTGQNKPITANLKMLHIAKIRVPDIVPPEAKAVQTLPVLLSKTLNALPPLNINIAQLFYDGVELGGVLWSSRPLKNGLLVQKVVLDMSAMDLIIQGKIQAVENGTRDQIHIKGQFIGRDYGAFLTKIGYPGILLQGAGPLNFNLSWKGVPNIDYETLNGRLQFDLKNGKILQINSGLMRVFGLFSLDTIMNALSFNFQKVLSSGLSYDLLKGQYNIGNGIAKTTDFEMEGPVINMKAQGSLDLEKSTIDERITVIPQVGTSIAVAAGFLGGPVIGVATWVTDKFLTSTVLKNKGIVLNVTGPLNAPKVSSVK